jgi:phosphatidylglycerophosphate synthase
VTVGAWAGTGSRPALAQPAGPAAGLLAQFAVLGALASVVGLGFAGWFTGITYGMVVWFALSRALQRSGMRSLGPANAVTLTRATLVGGVTALVVVHAVGHRIPVAVLVAVASVALLLDALDGHVARRTGSTSALGARFDMETDAFLILALSVFVAGYLGWWVLVIGGFRYVFVAASWVLPWLGAALPLRMTRKTVAALQGIVLVVAGSGVLPATVATVAVAAALALLCWSFARDIRWLWHADRRRAGQHEAVGPEAVVPR